MTDPVQNITPDRSAVHTNGRDSLAGRAMYWLLGLTVLFTTVAFGGVDPASSIIISVIGFAIVLLWVADAWSTGEIRIDADLILFPLIGLILIGLIQLIPLFSYPGSIDSLDGAIRVPISMDPYATRTFVSRSVVYLIFLAAAVSFLRSTARVRSTAYLIVGFGSILAFVSILMRLASPDAIYGLRPTPQAISFGPFVNQHHFAALMELTGGMSLAFVLSRGATRHVRVFFVIATIFMGIATVMTSSRGGILSFVATMVFVVLAVTFAIERSPAADDDASRARRLLPAIAGVAALMILIAGSILFLGADSELMRGIGLGGGDDISNGRAHFWPIAIKIFYHHPLLGTGLDAFGVAFTRFDTWPGLYRVEQAHNDYLQILADAGVAGFLCTAAFVYLLFKRGIANIGAAPDPFHQTVVIGAIAGCFGILIHSFFDFPLRTPANAFMFLLLVAISVVRPLAKTGSMDRN